MISDHLASAELPATPGRRNLAVLSTLPRRAAADGLTAVVLALVILLGPALFNGFPFIFADTGGYLARPFEGTLELGRSALYGTFLAAGIPFDFWPNVIIQALITVWIIHLTLRTHVGACGPGVMLAAILALTTLTSLPWYVGQLMPDIFLPLCVLALELLAFRSEQLSTRERAGLVGVIACAIAFHMSILALSLALLTILAVVRLLPVRWRLPRARLRIPAAGVAAGVALALVSNAVIGGAFAFTPGGFNIVFGRLVQDKLVTRYLDEHCPDVRLKLCQYRGQIPAGMDDWMWSGDSPLQKLGGWAEFKPEARYVVFQTLRTYPLDHLRLVIQHTIEQFVSLRTGDGFDSENNQHAEWKLSELAPSSMPRFRAAGQQHSRFEFSAINRVQTPLALLAIALLPALVWAWRARNSGIGALALTGFVALAANAAICGTFSGVGDRYQSRLAPIAVLVILTVMIECLRQRADRIALRSEG